jgi:hypothetical protein
MKTALCTAIVEPIDSAVFGSPIAAPDGVIGLVQDEQAGAFLPAPSEFAADLQQTYSCLCVR